MNVLDEDRCKAEALKVLINYCMKQMATQVAGGHRTGNIENYREAQKWSFELRDAQIQLDELFLRKEEFERFKNTRVIGRFRS
jgi:hypothetical protein